MCIPRVIPSQLTCARNALNLALGRSLLRAAIHSLVVDTFFQAVGKTCVEVRPVSAYIAPYADGLEDTATAKALSDRHAAWAGLMPDNVAGVWELVTNLDQDSLLSLLAHCVGLTVNAVKLPYERQSLALTTADQLATALDLSMTDHWTPSVRTYLSRVSKPHILDAVREAVSDEAADRMVGLKKLPMAEAAEALLVGTGWLPAVLRTASVADKALEEVGEE